MKGKQHLKEKIQRPKNKPTGDGSSGCLGGENLEIRKVTESKEEEVHEAKIKNITKPTDYKKWMDLIKACEKAKKDLGLSDKVRIATDDRNAKLTKHDFKKVNKPLLNLIDCMITMAMKAAERDEEQIDAYILVGNSALSPIVEDIVESRVEKQKRNYVLNTDDAAVIGAAHYANKPDGPLLARLRSASEDLKIPDNDEMGELLIKAGKIASTYPHFISKKKADEIRKILKSSQESFTKENQRDIIVRFLITPQHLGSVEKSIKKIRERRKLKLVKDKLKFLEKDAQSLLSSIEQLRQKHTTREKSDLTTTQKSCREIVNWINTNISQIDSFSEEELKTKQEEMRSLEKKFSKDV